MRGPGHLLHRGAPRLEGRFWVSSRVSSFNLAAGCLIGLVEVEDNLCTCFQGKQPDGNMAPLGFPGTVSQWLDLNLQALLFLTPSH